MASIIKTEKQLYARLKAMAPNAHWQRIETGAGTGVPDVNVCLNGVEEWLELKIALVKQGHMKIELRDSQVAWLNRRIRAGGRVSVVIGVETSIQVHTLAGAMLCNKRYQPIKLMKSIDAHHWSVKHGPA